MKKYILNIIKFMIGNHNVYDGSTCEISKTIFDVHDYPVKKGGDGIPSHFFEYRCSKCGKNFKI